MLYWILIGPVLFALFFFGRQNLQIYTDYGDHKGWEPYRLPLLVWIFAAIAAFIPVFNAIVYIMWFIGFSINLAINNGTPKYCYLTGDITIVPGKSNWMWLMVKTLSKKY